MVLYYSERANGGGFLSDESECCLVSSEDVEQVSVILWSHPELAKDPFFITPELGLSTLDCMIL